jgi:hypothetical protein
VDRFGIGAWTLKPWAWMLGLIPVGWHCHCSVTVLTGEVLGPDHRPVIDAVIVYYLMTPEVKQALAAL